MKATTSTKPQDYDKGVYKTIPYYDDIHKNILDLIGVLPKAPSRWLDTGCGTGVLIQRALPLWPEADFVLADPNPDMLSLARKKFGEGSQFTYILSGSEDILVEENEYDVITAVLSHHYLNQQQRAAATEKYFIALKPGGIFVTCEHMAPRTEEGRQLLLSRWEKYQISAGKTPEKAASHIARYGIGYYPITLQDHLDLLSSVGFSTVEVLWISYIDVVLYAVK